MTQDFPIITKHNPLPDLVDYLHSQGRDRLTLVADSNTYEALGRRVVRALEGQGFDLRTILLAGEEVMPDDYGKIRVSGEIVALTAQHIAVRRHDPRAGEVVVHFPRAGFLVFPAS